MYLHLGQDTVVLCKDILGIFDLDTSTVSKITREYLKRAEQNGDVVSVSTELPKTFVVCRDESAKSGRRIYLSQISTATLLKRMEFLPDNGTQS